CRLAASPMAGHTGELRLTFYPAGLKLAFEDGRLVTAEDWREDHAWGPRSMAGFPPGVFLRLLFGYRSLSELRDAYPDVQTNDEARPLLEALFPPRPTWILPLD
ncbi:MAG TPA: GNAT family N-acetyltransferase, partial [Spirochaetia bacterium]|nr:GNAT family N-acetyltransferase [Spirochaetia bacterium]